MRVIEAMNDDSGFLADNANKSPDNSTNYGAFREQTLREKHVWFITSTSQYNGWNDYDEKLVSSMDAFIKPQ